MNKKTHLYVLWTNGDPITAEKMVFMYTFNAQKRNWWDDITLVVWGPSAKLLTEVKELQGSIKKIIDVSEEDDPLLSEKLNELSKKNWIKCCCSHRFS